MRIAGFHRLPVLALVAVAALAVPQAGFAQSLDALDSLIQASTKPDDGVVMARSQADAGAWLDSLATLERVLAAKPKHKQARLLHASILCRLDDPGGARIAFARLKSGDYKKAQWAEATAPCNALTEAGR